MNEIKTFEELDKFIENNKQFSFYIANPMRRKFIKFDKEYPPDTPCYYLIKSDQSDISLIDVKLKKLQICKVEIEK